MKDPGAPHSGTRSPRLTRELSGFLKQFLASKTRQSDHGSALILTLLITALLATIVVSFLSTSRVEQIAARNFSRQNAATGLAEMATQQAMAKIQLGFNATGNGTGNFTSVITTQPGAINKYFFSNGTLLTNRTITTDLFSSGSGNLSYLNNLENPSSNSNATTNQFTITGNRSERINVFMENVTTTVSGNNTVIGRIAYYVDDEGTKLNANNAIGNRTTLNAALRPLDIGSLNATYSSNFTSVVNQSITTNSSSIGHWNYFFRSEQVGAAINSAGGNFSANDLPFLSTAVTSANNTANMIHLLTPWGTQRVFINEFSTNATHPIGPGNSTGDASVKSIFEALTGRTYTTLNGTTTYGGNSSSAYRVTGQGLHNIFGGNFSLKYTNTGVQQIAANILQMRDLNTNTVNRSFSYTGALLGSNNLNSEIPAEYLGHAPYLVISEIGMSACLAATGGGPTSYSYINPATNATVTVWVSQVDWGFKLQPVIELYNPYPEPFTIPAGAFPRVMLRPTRLSCNMSWSGPNGNFSGNFVFNSGASKPTAWTYSWWFGARTLSGMGWDNSGKYDLIYQANGNSTTIPPYSKIQTRLYLSGGVAEGFYTFIPLATTPSNPHNGGDITIHSVRDMKIQFDRVILLANSGNNVGNAASNYTQTIRDWVRGDEIGELDVEFDSSKLPYEFKWNGTSLIPDPDFAPPSDANGKAAPIPTKSVQRISCITKIPLATPSITINNTNRNWTTANSSVSAIWLSNSTTWVTSNSLNFGHLGTSNSTSTDTNLAPPSVSANFTTPSDPSLSDSVANAVYAGSNPLDMREPFLATGNYTCPADLGFVPTNQRWRRLRMQMQPSAEGSMIPDWAMLDVISFGNSTNANNAFNRMLPVNINGRFHLPGNATIAPRTIGLRALAKVLENSSADTIQDTMNPATTSNSTAATRFRGNTANATTIANAIGNMTWSANSTWSTRRSTKNFPSTQYILPSEIMEIAGVADAVSQTDYANSSSHFKWNEGRASALIPAVTTRSSFFTIYAYAQALDKTGNIDSEALTKTMLEVQYNSGNYTVKKLYTQPIPLGQ